MKKTVGLKRKEGKNIAQTTKDIDLFFFNLTIMIVCGNRNTPRCIGQRTAFIADSFLHVYMDSHDRATSSSLSEPQTSVLYTHIFIRYC